MTFKVGIGGPYLPLLVGELANGLRRANDHVVSTKGLLGQNLTIAVSVLFETYNQIAIAVSAVQARIGDTPGLGDTWAASFAGQSAATIGTDWAAVQSAATNLYNAIGSVLPRAADGSILQLTPAGAPRTLTLTTEQRTVYNGLADALTATLG